MSNAPRRAGRHFLQIPGPTPVPDRILRAMDMPVIDHRGPEFRRLGLKVLSGIRTVFKTASPVVIYPSSGTGAWEAALANTLSPGDKVLMYETGHFATLWRNIALAALHDVFGRLGAVLRGKARAEARRQVGALGIRAASIDLDISLLSGGNQQKAVLARWLLRNPTLLLLDEPTAGVDIGAKAEIHTLIRELAQTGMGVLVASSEFDELMGLCDRILVLCEGRPTGEFSRAEASEQRIMEAATSRRSLVQAVDG